MSTTSRIRGGLPSFLRNEKNWGGIIRQVPLCIVLNVKQVGHNPLLRRPGNSMIERYLYIIAHKSPQSQSQSQSLSDHVAEITHGQIPKLRQPVLRKPSCRL